MCEGRGGPSAQCTWPLQHRPGDARPQQPEHLLVLADVKAQTLACSVRLPVISEDQADQLKDGEIQPADFSQVSSPRQHRTIHLASPCGARKKNGAPPGARVAWPTGVRGGYARRTLSADDLAGNELHLAPDGLRPIRA